MIPSSKNDDVTRDDHPSYQWKHVFKKHITKLGEPWAIKAYR